MHRVTGRVVLRGTDVGVPRLLVSVYEVKSTSPATSGRGSEEHHEEESHWSRWGSVLTDARGTFTLVHGGTEQEVDGAGRPDLALVVSVSEDRCEPCNDQHDRIVTCIRENAGDVESFVIAVDEAQLTAAGIRAPGHEETVRDVIAQRRAASQRHALREIESQRLFVEGFKRRQKFERLAESKLETFLSALSGVPAERRQADSWYVPRGGSVLAANLAAIRSGIQGRIQHARPAGILHLSEEQAREFMDEKGNFRHEISGARLEHHLWPRRVRPTSLVRARRQALPCREGPVDPCVAILEATAAGNGAGQSATALITHEPPSSAPAGQPINLYATVTSNAEPSSVSLFYRGVGGSEFSELAMTEQSPAHYAAQIPAQAAGTAYYYIHASDGSNTTMAPPAGPADPYAVMVVTAVVPALVESMVAAMTPPESATVFNGNVRAGIQQVQQAVNGFTLHSGPADAPSVHDFHHLQVAFEHVWQELFDDDTTQIAKDLYAELVELGLDPDDYLTDLTHLASLGKLVKNVAGTTLEDPDPAVLRAFDISKEQWAALADLQKPVRESDPPAASDSWDYQEWLYKIATRVIGEWRFTREELEEMYLADPHAWELFTRAELYEQLVNRAVREHRRQGEKIIQYVARGLEPRSFNQLHPLLTQLDKALKRPYRFTTYAANRSERSVNFGIVATYRQQWQPLSYQVGELVKTVPLAPKEVRRFTKKVAIRTTRAEKEVQNNLHARKSESSETTRSETEIVQKALKKTNFQLSAEGSVDIGIAGAKGSSAFAQDASTESQEVKKEFREAVFKAAEEYKSERTLEVNVTTGEETTFEESGEISNPNDEISVTYLFYELQRRYHVSEQIHRVTPIVLVAQEFPKPSDIDEHWVITHDWILRRVILDDSFTPAMNYLGSKVVGDEFALQEMYQNLQQQRRIVDDLKEELVTIRAQVGRRYAALERSLKERAEAIQAEEDSGGIVPIPTPLGVGIAPAGGDAPSPEAMQVREDAARDAYEREAKLEKELQARLERETTAMSALTETYTKSLSDHLNRKAQIARLLVHLKSNIMYYMQAIWSHEPPDQRFFRLHQVQVPKLQGQMTYHLEVDPEAIPQPPDWKTPYKLVAHCELEPLELEFENLEEVADLDNLLGFKGNYMLFPLKRSNALTDFMMLPYQDALTGIRDPDPLGNWTLTDLIEHACCLKKKLSGDRFDRLLPGLQAAYQQLLNMPGAEGDEIIVPTDSLFIEALPGVHPILEDFKLFHRVIDVKKAQAEVRGMELENLRMAARLQAGEREDPNIEKKVVIEGAPPVAINPDDN